MQAYRRADPVAIPSPTLAEVSRGFHEKLEAGDQRFDNLLDWLEGFLGSGLVDLLPFDDRAAIVAGRVRARRPFPPSANTRRTDRGAEGRVSWFMDVAIASTAWAAGLDIVTPNRVDFEAIADELEALAPGSPRLVVGTPTF